MNINRHNYEEYFILYMDNELSSDDRRMVEVFVQQHPDLKEELDTLLQYKLEPDNNVVFRDKEDLMKVGGEKPILHSNYEEWLILYNDNELTPSQRLTVEEFMAANPVFEKEQELLLKTRLEPETIVFPDKSLLYRKEEKVRRMPVRWWRMAAAAVLLLAAGITAITMTGNKQTPGSGEIVKGSTGKEQKNIQPGVPDNHSTAENTLTTGNHTATANNNLPEPTISRPEKTTANDENPVIVKQSMTVNTNRVPGSKKDANRSLNNIQSPENKKQANEFAVVNNKPEEQLRPEKKLDAFQNAVSDGAGLTVKANPIQTRIDEPAVTKGDIASSPKSNPETDGTADDYIDEGGKNKKNRGLFRKLTRTIVKRSNANTKDDENDSKLLVGGFAFRMK